MPKTRKEYRKIKELASMLSESVVYGKRGAIPFFFEAPAFIVTSVMRSITFPKIGIRVMMDLIKSEVVNL